MSVLSDVQLATSGMSRSITFEGGRLDVQITRQGTQAGGFFFFASAAPMLAYACELAHARASGRHPIGQIGNLQIIATRVGGEPAIAVQRMSGDGRELGRPTVLAREEFVAFEKGVDMLIAEELEP